MGEKVAVMTGAVQQGQGDVVGRLEELASRYEADGDLWTNDWLKRAAQAFKCVSIEVVSEVRTLLSSSRGEQAWIPIDHAPKSRPIIGKTAAGRIVKAKWVRLDDDTAGWGTPEEDDPRPNCWDDGFCWASNSDEMPSDPLVAYIEMPGSVPTSLAGQVPDGVAAGIRKLNDVLNALWGADDCSAIAQTIGAKRLDTIFEAQNSLFAMLAAAPRRPE